MSDSVRKFGVVSMYIIGVRVGFTVDMLIIPKYHEVASTKPWVSV
jgi:hypothetical protein